MADINIISSLVNLQNDFLSESYRIAGDILIKSNNPADPDYWNAKRYVNQIRIQGLNFREQVRVDMRGLYGIKELNLAGTPMKKTKFISTAEEAWLDALKTELEQDMSDSGKTEAQVQNQADFKKIVGSVAAVMNRLSSKNSIYVRTRRR